MIIDELIAVFFSLFGLLLEGVSALFVGVFNLLAILIEFIVALFITDFHMRRASRYRRKKNKKEFSESNQEAESPFPSYFMPVLLILTVVAVISYQSVMKRDVTFVAEDGHSLPYAAVVIYTGEKVMHKRTKNDGSLKIPRFGVDKISLIDKRYQNKTWQRDEISETLLVKRSFLGQGVDALANKLLSKFKETK